MDDELIYACIVDNKAILIPEIIDAIKTLTGMDKERQKSLEKINKSLNIK